MSGFAVFFDFRRTFQYTYLTIKFRENLLSAETFMFTRGNLWHFVTFSQIKNFISKEDCFMSHSNSQEVYQLYDKIFKKILTLSSKAVINLINGLFETNYPTDSTITYNWTEHVNDDMRTCLADTLFSGTQSYPTLFQFSCSGRIHTLSGFRLTRDLSL